MHGFNIVPLDVSLFVFCEQAICDVIEMKKKHKLKIQLAQIAVPLSLLIVQVSTVIRF